MRIRLVAAGLAACLSAAPAIAQESETLKKIAESSGAGGSFSPKVVKDGLLPPFFATQSS